MQGSIQVVGTFFMMIEKKFNLSKVPDCLPADAMVLISKMSKLCLWLILFKYLILYLFFHYKYFSLVIIPTIILTLSFLLVTALLAPPPVPLLRYLSPPNSKYTFPATFSFEGNRRCPHCCTKNWTLKNVFQISSRNKLEACTHCAVCVIRGNDLSKLMGWGNNSLNFNDSRRRGLNKRSCMKVGNQRKGLIK